MQTSLIRWLRRASVSAALMAGWVGGTGALAQQVNLPAEDGWMPLLAAPDWTAPPRVHRQRHAQSVPSVAATTEGTPSPSAPAGEGTGTTERVRLDAPGTAGASSSDGGTPTVRAEADGGFVGIVGEATPPAIDPASVTALAGIRYRVLVSGDAAHPTRPPEDAGHVWLRVSARAMDGTPLGAQRSAQDQPDQMPTRMQWNELPPSLAAAVRQMPYHARWEIYVPSIGNQPGVNAYRAVRSSPRIFDVERFPPGA